VPDQSWDESAPAGTAFGQDAPAAPAADEWGAAPAAGAAGQYSLCPQFMLTHSICIQWTAHMHILHSWQVCASAFFHGADAILCYSLSDILEPCLLQYRPIKQCPDIYLVLRSYVLSVDGWDAAPAPAPQQAQFTNADQFGAQY